MENGDIVLYPRHVRGLTKDEDELAKAQNKELSGLGVKWRETVAEGGAKRYEAYFPAAADRSNLDAVMALAGPQFKDEHLEKVAAREAKAQAKDKVQETAAAKHGVQDDGTRRVSRLAELREPGAGVEMYPLKGADELKAFKAMVGDAKAAFDNSAKVWLVDAKAPNIEALKERYASPEAKAAWAAQPEVVNAGKREANFREDRRGTQERAATAHADKTSARGLFVGDTPKAREVALATWNKMAQTEIGRERLDAKLAITERDVLRYGPERAAKAAIADRMTDAEYKAEAYKQRLHRQAEDALAPAAAIFATLERTGVYTRKYDGAAGRVPSADDLRRLFPEEAQANDARASGKAAGVAPASSGPVLENKAQERAAPARQSRGLGAEL